MAASEVLGLTVLPCEPYKLLRLLKNLVMPTMFIRPVNACPEISPAHEDHLKDDFDFLKHEIHRAKYFILSISNSECHTCVPFINFSLH
mmetsp:Transcript_11473/g.23335  ORF Transcript_11473/g.23335 Transcript_11473/m.23335 type:complete len:89 (+) Transcript_11473:577-843(+)